MHTVRVWPQLKECGCVTAKGMPQQPSCPLYFKPIGRLIQLVHTVCVCLQLKKEGLLCHGKGAAPATMLSTVLHSHFSPYQTSAHGPRMASALGLWLFHSRGLPQRLSCLPYCKSITRLIQLVRTVRVWFHLKTCCFVAAEGLPQRPSCTPYYITITHLVQLVQFPYGFSIRLVVVSQQRGCPSNWAVHRTAFTLFNWCTRSEFGPSLVLVV